jgi:hypothetical protein
VFGADQKKEFIRKERTEFETLVVIGLETDRAIDFLVAKELRGLIGVAGLDGHLDFGEGFLEFLEHTGQDVLARGRAGADAKTGLTPLGKLQHAGAGVFHLFEDFVGVREQLFASESEENCFAQPVKKAAAQILLEGTHRMTDSRLGEAKFFRRHCETAVPGEGNEGAELPGINWVIHV